jgi:IS30 family transposase
MQSNPITSQRPAHASVIWTTDAAAHPVAVEDRAVPGHWEGDLFSGPNNSYDEEHQ